MLLLERLPGVQKVTALIPAAAKVSINSLQASRRMNSCQLSRCESVLIRVSAQCLKCKCEGRSLAETCTWRFRYSVEQLMYEVLQMDCGETPSFLCFPSVLWLLHDSMCSPVFLLHHLLHHYIPAFFKIIFKLLPVSCFSKETEVCRVTDHQPANYSMSE